MRSVVTTRRGEAVEIRGSAIGTSLLDGGPAAAFFTHDSIDSFEVIKGSVAVLYPNVSLTGTIIKTTKKPLPFAPKSFSPGIRQFWRLRCEHRFHRTDRETRKHDIGVSICRIEIVWE